MSFPSQSSQGRPSPGETLTRAPVRSAGRAVPAAAPGQPRRQVLPVFLALPQRLLLWLPAGAGLAPHTPRTCRGAVAPVLRAHRAGTWLDCGCAVGPASCVSAGPGGRCSCVTAQLLAPGAVEAASVQEQPLLKQNNLQKYRYSLCPRPDLAKEERGSCPGQGLAQPHRAFGRRGRIHPTLWAKPLPSPRVRSHSPLSERCSHRWIYPSQLPQSCPGPGHAVERSLSPNKGLWGQRCSPQSCRRRGARHVCAAGATAPRRPGSAEGAKRGHGRDKTLPACVKVAVGPCRPLAGRSLLLRAPGDVVGARGGVVLVNQLLHDLPGVVELVEVVLEDVLLAELLQESLPLAELVVLPARPLEQLENSAEVRGARAPGGSRGAGGCPARTWGSSCCPAPSQRSGSACASKAAFGQGESLTSLGWKGP